MEDGIRRWITGDGSFRILAASALATVREAVSICAAQKDAAKLYGELLIASALYQLALAPADRVQVAVENDGAAGKVLADIRSGVSVRGQLENPSAQGPLLSQNATLRVSRQPPRGGGYYESIIQVPGPKIADAFQAYALQSDQVVSFMALDVRYEQDEVSSAAGLFIQALPGATHDNLAQVTKCLEATRFEDQLMVMRDPFAVVPGMFYELELHELGQDPLAYRCGCSKPSLAGALGTLSSDNILEMVDAGIAEAVCEFCKTKYSFTGKELMDIHDRKLNAAATENTD